MDGLASSLSIISRGLASIHILMLPSQVGLGIRVSTGILASKTTHRQ
jgi:hypothetical protein